MLIRKAKEPRTSPYPSLSSPLPPSALSAHPAPPPPPPSPPQPRIFQLSEKVSHRTRIHNSRRFVVAVGPTTTQARRAGSRFYAGFFTRWKRRGNTLNRDSSSYGGGGGLRNRSFARCVTRGLRRISTFIPRNVGRANFVRTWPAYPAWLNSAFTLTGLLRLCR